MILVVIKITALLPGSDAQAQLTLNLGYKKPAGSNEGIVVRSGLHGPTPSDSLPPGPPFYRKRFTWSMVGLGTAYGGTMLGLGVLWYAQQGLGGWRWFDDNHQWLQVDKMGHAYTAYQQSRAVAQLLSWCGVPTKQRIIWGSLTGFLMQTPIEIFDGMSPDYGASWGDIAANATGSGLCALNEALWPGQPHRITMKWSFFPTDYPKDHPNLLGNNILQQSLKDYNGQTYWLSVSPDAWLTRDTRFERIFPNWLALAVGYGGDGMIGGYGRDPDDVIAAREHRQFYLGLDVDLTRIPAKSKFLRTFFFLLNAVRLPLPAIRFDHNGLRFFPVYF